MNASALASVELVESESVTERGTQKIVWFLWMNEAWTHPVELPGSVCTLIDQGRGTLWARRFELSVPVGTRGMRVEVRPQAAERLSPLQYLKKEVRGARQVTYKSYYLISPNGTLLPEAKKRTSRG